jgi:hypothetical protein
MMNWKNVSLIYFEILLQNMSWESGNILKKLGQDNWSFQDYKHTTPKLSQMYLQLA